MIGSLSLICTHTPWHPRSLQKRSRMPRDTNVVAHKVLQIAIGEHKESEPTEPQKHPAAVGTSSCDPIVVYEDLLVAVSRGYLTRRCLLACWRRWRRSPRQWDRHWVALEVAW